MSINKEIGERIRGIREIDELNINELAEKVNIEPELLEKYENGEVDIPVSVLQSISIALGIDMTQLMTGKSAKLSVYSIIRKDKGIGVDRRSAYDYKALAYNFTNRKMEPFLITIEPSADDEEISLNKHPGQEFHYCIEGSFKLVIGKHEVVINEGDAIYFDSTNYHGMKAIGDKPAKEIVIING